MGLSLILIFLLAIFTTSMVEWNRGFERGYDAGIADVFLGIVNPDEYFKKYLNPPVRKNK